MTYIDLTNFLPYRLYHVSEAVVLAFRKLYGPQYDLSIPEWRVLATLGQYDGITAKAIGAYSSMQKTKVSRAVRVLEDRNWLRREPNPADHREEMLYLTKLGRVTYNKIVPIGTAYEESLLAILGDDAPVFLSNLKKLENALADRPLDYRSPNMLKAPVPKKSR